MSDHDRAPTPLLAVSWEMPPMYGPRAAQVSMVLAELPALGWQPTVICLAPRRGGPNWPSGAIADPPPGVEYVRVPSPQEWWAVRAARRFVPALRDPDAARVWIPAATRAAIGATQRRPFAALITFAQPWSNHLVGLRVQRATGLPWVAHFSDPWVASPYATSEQRASWKRMEAEVVAHATKIVFVTREAADATMATYPAAAREKVAVVPHGFDPRRTPPSRERSRGARLRLVYTGRFYAGVRTPAPFLRALAALERDPTCAGAVEARFVGPYVEEFRRDAAAAGVNGLVTFKDRVPAADAAAEAADADVLLVIDAPSDTASLFLPSKLIDYLPFRKPILGLTPLRGASATLLTRLGCPIAAPDDVEAMAAALRRLVDDWRTGTLTVGSDFDRVAAEYDIRCTARQLHDVLVCARAENPKPLNREP